MALFKILSGPEKKNSLGTSVMLTPGTSGSPAHHEGWAYVTDEGNLYVDLKSTRVKIASNTDFAIKAEKDDSGQVITTTYIKGLAFLEANKAVPQLQYTLGSGSTGTLDLPVASSTQGGIITNTAQSIGGTKTFLANVNVNGVFDFVGIKEICQGPSGGSSAPADYWGDDKISPIWMARQADVSVPYYSNVLGYDYDKDILYVEALNKLNTTGTLYVGGASTLVGNTSITGTLAVTGATEIANTLKVTQKATFNNALDVIGATNLKANVIIGASASNTLTVNSATSLKSTLAVTGKVTLADQLVSNVALGIAPFVVTSTTRVDNLNADMVDDCHVSNDIFTDANHHQNKIPTQTAVWQSLEGLLRALQGLLYKGVLSPSSGSTTIAIPPSPKSGDVYVIGAEGTFAGTSTYVEPGDLVIAYKNSSGAIAWDAIQVNIDGAVRISGGGSLSNNHATDNAITRFDGTSGRVIQNSKIIIDDSGNLYPTSNDSQSIGIYNNDTKLRWKEIYAVNFRGLADRATHDDENQGIRVTYLADVNLVDHASKPYYNLVNGANEVKDTVYLPIASATTAGIITADKTNAQTITGAKIIDGSGSLTIQKTSGFTYSGIENGTTAADRVVWFADSREAGTPVKDSKFTYNPACTDKWDRYDTGSSVTAYGRLTAGRLNGIALKALQDDQGLVIKDTYIKGISFTNHATEPYLVYTLGSGSTVNVYLPVADADNAGVITNAAQIIAGQKTFKTGVNIDGANDGSVGFRIRRSANDGESVFHSITDSAYNITYTNDEAVSSIIFTLTNTDTESGGGANASSNKVTFASQKSTGSVVTATTFQGNATNATLAEKAVNDDSGQKITDTYIKGMVLSTSGTAPGYKFVRGSGSTDSTIGVYCPVASDTLGGIITTGAQSLKGKKTFLGGISVAGSAGITGVTSAGAAAELYLQYGVSKAIKLGNAGAYTISADGSTYSGTAANATNATNAVNATKDAAGNVISGYIRSLSFVTASTPSLRCTKGDNTSNDVALPVASASAGGVVTTGTQTLAGAKTFSSAVKITASTASSSTSTGALIVSGGAGIAGNLYAAKVYNAVWNDYAEFREAETRKPGRVIIEHKSGEMKVSTKRLQPGGLIVSDTFGHAMGQTKKCRTPVAVAGRVLAYPYEDRNSYPLGAAVCTGPGGTVSLMTRAEIREYPERIIGTVSEIPDYETWGQDNVKVNGRIWIKVK